MSKQSEFFRQVARQMNDRSIEFTAFTLTLLQEALRIELDHEPTEAELDAEIERMTAERVAELQTRQDAIATLEARQAVHRNN